MKNTSAPAAANEDILLAVDTEIGWYLISLITRDLRSNVGQDSPGEVERRTGFALYLRDRLPPSPIPVPAVCGRPIPDGRDPVAKARRGYRRGSASHGSKPGRSEAV